MGVSTVTTRRSIFFFEMLLVLILLLIPPPAGADEDAEVLESYIIQQSPSMRLEGRYTFNFNPSHQGGEVRWSVDRSVNGKITTGVLSASGLEATFNLTWSKGNTTYIIHARDGGAEDEVRVQIFPPDKGIRYKFVNPYHNGPAITVRILVPEDLSPNTNVVSVHHGASRSNYFSYWTDWGKKAGWIIIAPHFPDSGKWAGSRGYNLGNMFSGKEGAGHLLPKEQWSYQIAVDFAKAVLDGFDLNDKAFDMWGHSAGGQFTHRTMLFVRDAPIRRGMPANPGWWTLPVYDSHKNYKYPYGPYHPKLDYDQADLNRFTAMHGIVHAGDKDTKIDSSLRQTPEANAQGRHRWARAKNMYEVIEKENPAHNWGFVRAPGIGHDGRAMSEYAQQWLEDNPVAENPVAIFQAVPASGQAPLDVKFDASASFDPQGAILESYEWDFGDNNTGIGKTIEHRYDNPGSYPVRLTVTNNTGRVGAAALTINATNPFETIAIDGFESKNFSGGEGWLDKWTKKGGAKLVKKKPYEGKRYAYITGGKTPGYLERAVDLSNVPSARLKFAGRVKSFENQDKAYVKVSPDGVTYTVVAEFTPADSDNRWHLYDIDLSAFTMSADFRIVFEGAMGRKTKDKWYLDHIEVLNE